MKTQLRILFLSLFTLIVVNDFNSALIAEVNENVLQNSVNSISESENDEFVKLMDAAKEIMFWDMHNFPGEDKDRPKIVNYPPTLDAVHELMQKLVQIEYKKLNKSNYVDFMLLTHYLYSVLKENEILRDYETDPQTYLMPIYSICFKYSENIDKGRIYNALHKLSQMPKYYSAARKYLKTPYAEFLKNSIDRMNYLLNFLNVTLTRALMDNIDTIPNETWVNVLYKSIQEAEEFKEFLQSLESKSVELTEEMKLKRKQLTIEHRFKYRHLIPESPAELLKFAQDEFKKIDAEMKKIAIQINANEGNTERVSDDWHAIIEEMKDDCPEESEILGLTENYFNRAKKFIAESGVFPLSPRIFDIEVEKYEVKGDQKNTPYAFYLPLGRKIEQNGKYKLALPSMEMAEFERKQKIRDLFKERLLIITVHECFPGHHLQFSWAQNIERSFLQSRLGYSTVYVEGWGLYSEQIMEELGFYNGLKGRLAMLKMRLWRAARVIIDVSRQFFGMTEEDAVKLLTEKIMLEKINAEAEVRRYFNSPTQPSSYLYGWREINRLRDRMIEKQALAGEQFSLYNFHKAFLDSPYIPVYLLWGTMFGEYKEPLFDFDEFLNPANLESQKSQEK